MNGFASLAGMLAQPDFDLGPVFPPATGADDVAESEHGIDISLSPMHASSFQASLDDELIAAFHCAAADGPALGLEEGILDLVLAFLEIGQVAGNDFCLWMLALQLFQLEQ